MDHLNRRSLLRGVLGAVTLALAPVYGGLRARLGIEEEPEWEVWTVDHSTKWRVPYIVDLTTGVITFSDPPAKGYSWTIERVQ